MGAFYVEDRDVLDLLAQHRLMVSRVRLRLLRVRILFVALRFTRLPLFWITRLLDIFRDIH